MESHEPRPRYTPAIADALRDISRAVAKAAEDHDLTSNEVLVVLASVASHWVPSEALPSR